MVSTQAPFVCGKPINWDRLCIEFSTIRSLKLTATLRKPATTPAMAVRQMDEIAALNFKETAPYIRSGSIGDIGCSIGSWIKQGGAIHTESDFYGIELARNLFDICLQRKHNGEFTNLNTFFSMKNAVSDLVFRPDSMTTIHTGSITHEIFSYGSREDLLKFIGNRFRELQPGGVWINRDVVGPEKGEQQVFLHLSTADGVNDGDEVMALEEDQIAEKQATFVQYILQVSSVCQ